MKHVPWIVAVLALLGCIVFGVMLFSRTRAQERAVLRAEAADSIAAAKDSVAQRVLADSARWRVERDSALAVADEKWQDAKWWANRASDRASERDSLITRVTTLEGAVALAQAFSADLDTLGAELGQCADGLRECQEAFALESARHDTTRTLLDTALTVTVPTLRVALDSLRLNVTGPPLINIDGLGRTLGLAAILTIAIKIAEWLIH